MFSFKFCPCIVYFFPQQDCESYPTDKTAAILLLDVKTESNWTCVQFLKTSPLLDERLNVIKNLTKVHLLSLSALKKTTMTLMIGSH